MGSDAAVSGAILTDYMDCPITLYRVTVRFHQSYKYNPPQKPEDEPAAAEWKEQSGTVGYSAMVKASRGKDAFDMLVAFLAGPDVKKTQEIAKHGESKIWDLERKDFEIDTIEAIPWGRLLLNDFREQPKKEC